MDSPQCSIAPSLVEAFQSLPDPRCARGVRHPWWVILTVLAAGLAAGQEHCRGIAQWAAQEAAWLGTWLPLHKGRPPSETTLQRALRLVSLGELQAALTEAQQTNGAADHLEGVAIDGKSSKGAPGPGRPLHLISLARHKDAAVLGQRPVGAQENEYTASPALLLGIDWRGRVLTGDAFFCQRLLTSLVRRRGGHWLLAVKANQPALLAACEAHFADAPPLAVTCSLGSDHGRLERRGIDATDDLNGELDWPGLGLAIRRTTTRWEPDGVERTTVSYWITSLRADQVTHRQLEALCRGHWTIENKVHWIRDVTFGEDRSTVRTGHAPQTLALLRSAVRWLLVERGRWPYVPDAQRYYRSHPGALRSLMGG